MDEQELMLNYSRPSGWMDISVPVPFVICLGEGPDDV